MRKINTMEEFAKVSGISRPTLSKYFNDPKSVRASTRTRIEEALNTFDYTPNVYAINQNRRTTRNIGIIVPNLADPFFTEIGREAEMACINAGYSPIVLSSHGHPDQEITNLESLKSLKPAGVLLAPFGRVSNHDAVRRVADDLPMVLFDANIADVGSAYFGTDNAQSFGMIIDYLCRSGEPPCLFEMKTPLNPNARRKHQVYIDSMARHGLTPRIHKAEGEGWDFEEIGYREGGRMLQQNVFETNTILCSNDRLAIGLLSAAYRQGHRVGLEPGCSLRVAGHDDHPFARFTSPRLTTVAQDYTAIAKGAAEYLVGMIVGDTQNQTRQETEFPGRLVMRESA